MEATSAGAPRGVVTRVAARLRALVRRSHGQSREVLRAHGVTLDPAARTVEMAGAGPGEPLPSEEDVPVGLGAPERVAQGQGLGQLR